ncbi:MAG: hypothetical protein OHK93_004931 [Ramalina farinacea]|uniref:Uncharacterized protein n=1 Tax=Ramalina farinacea TaxID=258253 RepID=A0AA43QX04_9LECA|nr:hypothetical protein [Ramalina farinacea]
MPPIKEPIDFDALPNNVGQLKAIIWRLAFQKNAIIKARDDHINTLLEKNQALECSLQLCRESLAAADAATSPASASELSESDNDGSTAPSSPHSSPPASSLFGGDSDSLPDINNNDPPSEMEPRALDDRNNDEIASDTKSGTSANLENDELTSGMEREASSDLDNNSSAGETEPRASPTPSIRSRTSGLSRVSKTQKRGRSTGNTEAQAIWGPGRRRVWSYSGGRSI